MRLPADGSLRMRILDELDHARRPPVHETRRPVYGSLILPPERSLLVGGDLVELHELDGYDRERARSFADGRSTFLVHLDGPADADSLALAHFRRSVQMEADLVEIQESTEAFIVQRTLLGRPRLFMPDAVVDWNGREWTTRPNAAALLGPLSKIVPTASYDVLRGLLELCVHWLSPGHVGATLVLRLDGGDPVGDPAYGFDEVASFPSPRLSVRARHHFSALYTALSQTDLATLVDADGTVRYFGVGLNVSARADLLISDAAWHAAPVGAAVHVRSSRNGRLRGERGRSGHRVQRRRRGRHVRRQAEEEDRRSGRGGLHAVDATLRELRQAARGDRPPTGSGIRVVPGVRDDRRPRRPQGHQGEEGVAMCRAALVRHRHRGIGDEGGAGRPRRRHPRRRPVQDPDPAAGDAGGDGGRRGAVGRPLRVVGPRGGHVPGGRAPRRHAERGQRRQVVDRHRRRRVVHEVGRDTTSTSSTTPTRPGSPRCGTGPAADATASCSCSRSGRASARGCSSTECWSRTPSSGTSRSTATTPSTGPRRAHGTARSCRGVTGRSGSSATCARSSSCSHRS